MIYELYDILSGMSLNQFSDNYFSETWIFILAAYYANKKYLNNQTKNDIFCNSTLLQILSIIKIYKPILQIYYKMTNAMSKLMIPQNDIEYNISKYLKGELALKSFKLIELKAFAKYNNLRISGTKTELIERIETFYNKAFIRNKNAIIIQSVFRGHLVRFSIKLRGCALYQRTICVNDTDFITLEPIGEIDVNDFYSYVDENNFVYGFSVSSLISLFKRKGHIMNPYNREKMKFKTLNEIFTLYKIGNLLVSSSDKTIVKHETNSVIQMDNNAVATLTREPVPEVVLESNINAVINTLSDSTSVASTITPVSNIVPVPVPGMDPIPVTSEEESIPVNISRSNENDLRWMNELRERMNSIQSRTLVERIRELFMEIDQLGNYTSATWFYDLDLRGLYNYFRYLWDIWVYRGQIPQQIKVRICSLKDPFSGLTQLRTTDINVWRERCIYVMEHMVYTGVDVEYQRIGTLHVLSALTLVSMQARQVMYWLYEGLVY